MKRLIVLFAAVALAADPAPPAVTLKVIRYDELTAAVRQLRGKVVVVDFWADFCLPCKREFPRLMELARRHAGQPVAVVSVALDEPAKRPNVEAFLRKQCATIDNYLLNEPYPFWQAKLKIEGPPLVFVFNRKGELARRFADEAVDYDNIGNLVNRLLVE
jgi:thiol-disulfide isomerase/thioredoxin